MKRKLLIISLIAGFSAFGAGAQTGGGAGGAGAGGATGAGAGTGSAAGGTGASVGGTATGGSTVGNGSSVGPRILQPGQPGQPGQAGQTTPFNTDTGVGGGRNPAIPDQSATTVGGNVNAPRTAPSSPGAFTPVSPINPAPGQAGQANQIAPGSTTRTLNNPAQLQRMTNQFGLQGGMNSADRQLGTANNQLNNLTNQSGVVNPGGLTPTGGTNSFNRVLQTTPNRTGTPVGGGATQPLPGNNP
ncbi:MAG TPA: hypothetical protein VEH04_16690 [Verrucomicrobiae bacterium]|nr:hypothetical protein [Verrucomicrobiae bacterium]